jgi:cytochrome P450
MTAPVRKYDLYSHDFKADPHPTFAAMRRDDPVLYQPGLDGETLLYFSTRYADVEHILTDEAHFRRDFRAHGRETPIPDPRIDDLVNNHMLNKDGADHRRLRSLVTQAFTPKRVREMRPRVQAIADELLDRVEGQGQMDLIADYAFHLPTIVILEMLGIPAADREKFRAWSNAVIMPTLDEASFMEVMRLMAEFLAYLEAFFAERRAAPTDDLVSALIQAEEAGDRLSQGELMGMLMLLIVAGHETTVNLIGNAMVALWHNPDQLAKLTADPALMPAAVEEFLRYDGSVERAFARLAVDGAAVGGETLVDQAGVLPILAAANRDPAVFHDPDRLDIGRSPNPHLSFGKGAHYCLGAPLARLEAEIALNTLLRRLPGLRPSIPLDELRWRLSPTFRSLEALPVVWDQELNAD